MVAVKTETGRPVRGRLTGLGGPEGSCHTAQQLVPPNSVRPDPSRAGDAASYSLFQGCGPVIASAKESAAVAVGFPDHPEAVLGDATDCPPELALQRFVDFAVVSEFVERHLLRGRHLMLLPTRPPGVH